MSYLVVGFEGLEAGLEGVEEFFFGPEVGGASAHGEFFVEVLEVGFVEQPHLF